MLFQRRSLCLSSYSLKNKGKLCAVHAIFGMIFLKLILNIQEWTKQTYQINVYSQIKQSAFLWMQFSFVTYWNKIDEYCQLLMVETMTFCADVSVFIICFTREKSAQWFCIIVWRQNRQHQQNHWFISSKFTFINRFSIVLVACENDD